MGTLPSYQRVSSKILSVLKLLLQAIASNSNVKSQINYLERLCRASKCTQNVVYLAYVPFGQGPGSALMRVEQNCLKRVLDQQSQASNHLHRSPGGAHRCGMTSEVPGGTRHADQRQAFNSHQVPGGKVVWAPAMSLHSELQSNVIFVE